MTDLEDIETVEIAKRKTRRKKARALWLYRQKVLTLGALSIVSVVAFVGCSQAIDSPPSGGQAQSSDVLEGFESYYYQTLDWQQCTVEEIGVVEDYANYFCTTVSAPTDWSDPLSEPISLAVALYQTGSGDSLFFNLGGPGAAAVSSLPYFVQYVASENVVREFNIVAVDPRGVGQSTQINCLTDAEKDQVLSGSGTETSLAGLDELIDFYAEIGEQCVANSGDLAANVDSYSAARDYDLVRSLLGETEFNYLGFSYGTYYGAAYADLFAEKVGRMVLDGAIDPQIDYDGLGALQAAGFEESLDHWLDLAENGQFDGFNEEGSSAEELKTKIRQLLLEIKETPLSTDDSQRPLTYSLAITGMARCLYSSSRYAQLATALEAAFAGDGSDLLQLADKANGRGTDGTYDNTLDAFLAISALDFPVGEYTDADKRQWLQNAQKTEAENPVFGSIGVFSTAQWANWPVSKHEERQQISAEGVETILVIGTTHDPATPYAMAEALSEQLPNSKLLTVDGWSHTAYSRSASACVTETVDGYLMTGEVANVQCNG